MNPGPQSPSTDGDIYLYPPEYYPFDNFSAFQVEYKGKIYPTSEHAHQSLKFAETNPELAETIRLAKSAHDAMTIARENKSQVNPNWDNIKLLLMKEVLMCKVNQHEYVKKKLAQSGDRIIIEDSWRDSYWGWGEDHKGENMLGKVWMEVRKELREKGEI